MRPQHELRRLLERIRVTGGTDADRQALHCAVLAGELEADLGARRVHVEGSVEDSIIVGGDGNILMQGVAASDVQNAIAAVLATIAEDEQELALKAYFSALRAYAVGFSYLELDQLCPLGRDRSRTERYVPPVLAPMATESAESSAGNGGTGDGEDPGMGLSELLRDTPADQPLLIIGAPGAGKSTLLRHLVRHAWEDPAEVGLSRRYLPFVVPLRCVAGTKGQSLESRLRNALEDAGEPLPDEPIPNGFLRAWPERMGASWLFLLDAMDEVSHQRRSDLLRWLQNLTEQMGARGHRIVVTSRPLVERTGLERRYRIFRIRPFEPEQRESFARNWFQERAGSFLEQLERLRASPLSNTPLLLTIAAAVYEGDGELPERRSSLYQRFSEILLDEASRRGLTAELGSQLSPLASRALAAVAMAILEAAGSPTRRQFHRAAADYLQAALGCTSEIARVEGEAFTEVMARRSGLLVRRGSTYGWVHASLGDYLAATRIADIRDPSTDSAQTLAERWQQEQWRDPILFCLNIWSDEGQDVSRLVEPIWRQGAKGLFFAAAAIAEGARVEPALGDAIHLLAHAHHRHRGSLEFAADYPQLFAFLEQLPERDWDTSKLVVFAREEGLARDDRLDAVRALGASRETAGLLALAHDPGFDFEARVLAAELIGESGPVEEAQAILRDLARDPTADPDRRFFAAESLGRLGAEEEAGELLFDLCYQGNLVGIFFLRLVKRLGEFGCLDQLRRLIGDPRLLSVVRVSAAQQLARGGDRDGAEPLLSDRRVDWKDRIDLVEWLIPYADPGRLIAVLEAWVTVADEEATAELERRKGDRMLAQFQETTVRIDEALGRKPTDRILGEMLERIVGILGRLGRLDRLRSMLGNDRFPPLVQVAAAKALGLQGDSAAARAFLKPAVQCRDEDAPGLASLDTATKRAQAVAALAAVEGAQLAPTLCRLARDATEADEVRLAAAKALASVGDRETALQLLTEKALDVSGRIEVAEALGELGCAEGHLRNARDPEVWGFARLEAIKSAIALGSRDAAPAILEDMLEHPGLDDFEREQAQTLLETLGQSAAAMRLLGVIRDPRVETEAKRSAIVDLWRLHRFDDLLAAARDASLGDEVRAAAMGFIDRKVLLEQLAGDTGLPGNLRVLAAYRLAEKGDTDTATQTLLGFVHEDGFDAAALQDVAYALGELRQFAVLRGLVEDRSVDIRLRAAAVTQLSAPERADEILSLARNGTLGEGIAIAAVRALGDLERVDRLLDLARDRSLGGRVREAAVEMLGRLRRSEALLELAREAWPLDQQGLFAEPFGARAALALEKMGDRDALSLLAGDEGVEGDVRMAAAGALGRLDRLDQAIPVLRSLAGDAGVSGFVRYGSAHFLRQYGKVEEAAGIMRELAVDEDQRLSLREMAAKAMVALGKLDQVQAIAEDPRAEPWLRASAASELSQAGREEAASEILLSMLVDQRVEADVRVAIADAFGDTGDAAVLPLLESRLSDVDDGRVEAAVLRAIATLRRALDQPGEESRGGN